MTAPAAPLSQPTLIPGVLGAALVDDWTTFAHDQMRTGFQPQQTGISSGNVGSLALRWSAQLGESATASPLVANGTVYVAGRSGTVRAFDSGSGKTLWSTNVGGPVTMTPALADGLLFVGTHGLPGTLQALDAATGAKRWVATLPGAVRSEPVVLDGVVYTGDASGDPPTCNHGGIHGFGETTGAPVMSWFDDTKPNDGGAVWSPISTDGTALYFGTGNTCSPGVSFANSEVKLTTGGEVLWSYNAANVLADDDVGTASMLLGNDAIAADKNGTLYDFDRTSGRIVWSTKLGMLDGYGPVGSASSYGQTIVEDDGYINDPTEKTVDPQAYIFGLTRSGTVLWKIEVNDEVRGNIPINNGVAYAGANRSVMALDIRSGAKLWSYPVPNDTYASPAIVPSGLYFVDTGGVVYAFGLPSASSAAVRRR